MDDGVGVGGGVLVVVAGLEGASVVVDIVAIICWTVLVGIIGAVVVLVVLL